MAQQTKISVLGLTVYTMIVGLLIVGTANLTLFLLAKTHFPPDLATVVAALDSAIVAVAVTVALEMKISGVNVSQALKSMGLKKGNRVQIKASLLGLSPLALSYLMIFAALEIPADTVPELGWVMFKFFIAQGLSEEIIFRGFIFRHMRRQFGFFKAATFSGILFALIHLANFSHGISVNVAIGVAISIVFGFILTFPLARLFEIGAGSIAGGAIFHLGIDSINWFEQPSSSGIGLATYLTGVVGAAVAVMLTTRRHACDT